MAPRGAVRPHPRSADGAPGAGWRGPLSGSSRWRTRSGSDSCGTTCRGRRSPGGRRTRSWPRWLWSSPGSRRRPPCCPRTSGRRCRIDSPRWGTRSPWTTSPTWWGCRRRPSRVGTRTEALLRHLTPDRFVGLLARLAGVRGQSIHRLADVCRRFAPPDNSRDALYSVQARLASCAGDCPDRSAWETVEELLLRLEQDPFLVADYVGGLEAIDGDPAFDRRAIRAAGPAGSGADPCPPDETAEARRQRRVSRGCREARARRTGRGSRVRDGDRRHVPRSPGRGARGRPVGGPRGDRAGAPRDAGRLRGAADLLPGARRRADRDADPAAGRGRADVGATPAGRRPLGFSRRATPAVAARAPDGPVVPHPQPDDRARSRRRSASGLRAPAGSRVIRIRRCVTKRCERSVSSTRKPARAVLGQVAVTYRRERECRPLTVQLIESTLGRQPQAS